MRDRTGEDTAALSHDSALSIEMIMQANGVSRATAQMMHLEMWTCVHGIGVMLATSFMPLAWELVSDVLSDVYQGLRARHTMEEKQ